jgi:periplasmic copper chaperone A
MRAIIATAVFVALGACDKPPAEPRVTVEAAVVTLPAIKGRPGAAYFTLHANTRSTRLIGVASPRIERIELHESRTEGGISRMAPLDRPMFEGRRMEFKPGGRHAMLFGIDPTVAAGGKIPLTFSFEGAPPVTALAQVRAAGDGDGGH